MIITVEQRLQRLEEVVADLEQRMIQREADDKIARETVMLMLETVEQHRKLITNLVIGLQPMA
jgi:hypothetical protein